MRIDIVTVQPGLLEGAFSHSILKRAQDKGVASVHEHDLRPFGSGKHFQVDDNAYGGGAGMVGCVSMLLRVPVRSSAADPPMTGTTSKRKARPTSSAPGV